MEDPRNKPGKRTVHLYCVVRVTVPNVEADSDAEAIEKAYEEARPHDLFHNESVCNQNAPESGKPYVKATAYADDLEDALVDHDGDPEFEFTTTYVQDHRAKGGWRATGHNPEGSNGPVC